MLTFFPPKKFKGNFEQIFIQRSTFQKVSQQKQDVSSGLGLFHPESFSVPLASNPVPKPSINGNTGAKQ